jgi:hypothetical protein
MRFYTGQHRFHCGIDLHAHTMAVCILDATSERSPLRRQSAHGVSLDACWVQPRCAAIEAKTVREERPSPRTGGLGRGLPLDNLRTHTC